MKTCAIVAPTVAARRFIWTRKNFREVTCTSDLKGKENTLVCVTSAYGGIFLGGHGEQQIIKGLHVIMIQNI